MLRENFSKIFIDFITCMKIRVMKKVLIIFLSAICLIAVNSCGSGSSYISNEAKAEKAIREYFKYKLHDYDSYQIVSFGALTKLPSPAEAAQKLLKKRAFLDSLAAADKDQRKDIETYLEYLSDSIRIAPNYGPGWKVQHTFRAKVPLGGYMLHNYEIYLNVDLTQVKGIVDLDE